MVATAYAASRRQKDGLVVLKASGMIWFTAAALGQFAFGAYILLFYGGTALQGDWAAWSARMIVGFVDADLLGNLSVLSHMLLALIMCVGGPLQFIPMIRKRWPVLHRWNGRMFATAAVLIALGGLYLTWARGMAGLFNELTISANALLMLVFAGLTVRAALMRRFGAHHRWALRLFIVASGVWFFRVGYGFWFMATGGEMPGVGPMLDGPTDYVLAAGSYLAPLLVLELYQRARDAGGIATRYAAAVLVLCATVATSVGLVGAAIIFWLPALMG